MNHIQRLKNAINDFETIEPNLKRLVGFAPEIWEQELIKEYTRLAIHPLPQEALI
jgi:hypothetical protein